jgi:hypothetical protein
MIDALIQGHIYGQPAQRTAKTGSTFVTTKVRVAAGDGEGIFASVICFDATTCTALLALGDGDAVAMAGPLTPKVWTDKEGIAKPALDIVCHQIVTPYHVQRKRRATTDKDNSPANHLQLQTGLYP